MGSRAHEAHAGLAGDGLHLGQRLGEVGPCLGDIGAHARDDLDGGFEKLVLGAGVQAVGVAPTEDRQELRASARQLTAVLVNELQLHLYAYGGPR